MREAVTAQEARLVALARAVVSDAEPVDVRWLLAAAHPAPTQLRPAAARLLGDALARGTVAALARQGGWRAEGGRRLWERHPAPALRFTANAVRLLQWVVRTPLGDREVAPLELEGPLTAAEEVFAVLLFERARGTPFEAALARQPALRAAPLVALAFPAELGAAAPLEAVPPLRPEEHGVAVEGLSALLARSWLAAERGKRRVERVELLLQAGRAQQAVLDAFLPLAAAGREQWATFLIDAGVAWLAGAPTAAAYGAELSPTAPLGARQEARRAAGAFLRGLGVLQGWYDALRHVRFVDDDYAKAQALVGRWSALGEPGFAAVARLVAELERL